MKRRLILPALLAATTLALAAPAPVVAAPPDAGDYTSPDRRTGSLPFVELDGMTKAPAGSGYERYTSQKVSWKACGEYQCADILTPMDHGDPDGVAITIHLQRKRASRQPRLGSVLMNPGGPGAPGSNMSEQPYPGLRQYDIVGFDPRGTGKSTPIQCYAKQDSRNVPESDERAAIDQSPDDDAEYQALLKSQREFGDSCAQHSGVYLQYVTTEQVIGDMDLMRQLLGDEKLTYVGYSYGTYLGAMYAHYYPDRVGRMVLDSPVNITTDDSISQSQGFDRALGLFAEWAAKRGTIGNSKEQVISRVRGLLDDLDARPLPGDGRRKLTQSLALTGIITLLYGSQEEWGVLADALATAYQGDGGYLLNIADYYNDRDPNGVYATGYYAFPVMGCADSPDKGLKKDYEDWAVQEKKAPIFGKYFGPGYTCEQWPVAPQPIIDLSAPTAAPILVVGSTGDPATPFEYAGWMVKTLAGGARLLTWDGPGHGTFGGRSACINDAVNGYLVDGTMPEEGKTCRA